MSAARAPGGDGGGIDVDVASDVLANALLLPVAGQFEHAADAEDRGVAPEVTIDDGGEVGGAVAGVEAVLDAAIEPGGDVLENRAPAAPVWKARPANLSTPQRLDWRPNRQTQSMSDSSSRCRAKALDASTSCQVWWCRERPTSMRGASGTIEVGITNVATRPPRSSPAAAVTIQSGGSSWSKRRWIACRFMGGFLGEAPGRP